MPDFASPSFGGFAFIGSLAALTQFSFRPKTLMIWRSQMTFSQMSLNLCPFFWNPPHSCDLVKDNRSHRIPRLSGQTPKPKSASSPVRVGTEHTPLTVRH
jgi:hypothetical protein